jgi:hypothetical protein
VLAAILFCATAVSLARPAVAGTGEGLGYIEKNQAPDGGFAEPGRTAGADATTAWCIMALRAGGADPNAMKQGGRSPLDFLATQAGNWRSVTDYERTLLAVAAAGKNTRSFGGVDLLARVQSYQRAGGNIGDAINSNAFGILSYRAAGAAIPPGAVEWHVRNQNGDGGWGIAPRTAIGQRKTGEVLFLVIDGRTIDSIGATLKDIQDILLQYGAYNASNLDGGSSTTMYFNGKVINKPSDKLGERTVPTAFIVEPPIGGDSR